MLYAFIGSLLAGSLATVFVLWRKAQVEARLAESLEKLKAASKEIEERAEAFDHLKSEYNSLVDRANAQIAELHKEKERLLDALEKSGKPGVFGELLRSRNTTKTPSES